MAPAPITIFVGREDNAIRCASGDFARRSRGSSWPPPRPVTRPRQARRRRPVVYHQANGRILSRVRRAARAVGRAVVDCIAEYGNTSAATLPSPSPTASGGPPAGRRPVLLGAFGGGLHLGATVVEWGSGEPPRVGEHLTRPRVLITGVGAVTRWSGRAGAVPGLFAGSARESSPGSAPCSAYEPGEFLSVKEARRSDRFTPSVAIAASTLGVDRRRLGPGRAHRMTRPRSDA